MVLAVISVLLAAAMAYAAVRKLSGRPEVVTTYTRIGVPEERLRHLALILLAGAAGLVLGLIWTPVGIAAAAGTSVYFALAVIVHLRAGDARNAGVPVALNLLADAALVLHVVT